MARSGSFGRLPKVAPDLSATIAQLLAEYAAQVDSNYVDAWKNGGSVDGKPVTDDRLLKHFRERRDELDKDSPEYQQWNNRILQYQFSIEESKMTVKWDNKQATAADMAAFYHRWEQKTPDDTEFDRTLRKAYGQWMQSANARNAADDAAAKAAAHANYLQSQYDKYIKPAHQATQAISYMLFEWGVIPGQKDNGQTVPPDNISGLEANSGNDWETLMAVIQSGNLSGYEKSQLDMYTAYMKKIDPTFEWTSAWFQKASANAQVGIANIVSAKGTTKEEAKVYSQIGTDATITSNVIGAAPKIISLKAARKQWEDDMAASMGDPAAQRAATEKYLGYLQDAQKALSSKSTNPLSLDYDTNLLPGINAEADLIERGLKGEKITGTQNATWMDTSTGGSGNEVGANSDAQSWANVLNGMNENEANLQAGGSVVVVTDSKGEAAYAVQPPGPNAFAGYVQIATVLSGRPVIAYVQPKNVVMTPVGGPTGTTPTGGKPVQVDVSTGMYTDKNGQPTNDITQAVTTSDAPFQQVTLPSPDKGDISWYVIPVPGSDITVRSALPPIKDAHVQDILDGNGNKTGEAIVFNQGVDSAGVNYNPYDYMTFGPSTSTDSIKPKSPVALADEVAGDGVTKTGKQVVTSVAPGFTVTDSGAMYQAQLFKLDTKDKNYLTKRNAILNNAAQTSATFQAAATTALQNGDWAGASKANTERQQFNMDWKNIQTLAVAQASGDISSLGLQKAAQTIQGTGAIWNGSTLVATKQYNPASAQGVNMDDARRWAIQSLDAYEQTWGTGSINKSVGSFGPAIDPNNPGAKQALASGQYTNIDPFFTHDANYVSLREQLQATQDPRQLKLPTGIASGDNPYLPVTLPTTGAPVIPGAPQTTAGASPNGAVPPLPGSGGTTAPPPTTYTPIIPAPPTPPMSIPKLKPGADLAQRNQLVPI